MSDLAETYSWFFDLEFVRDTNAAARDWSDKTLLAALLDPDQTAPLRPNVLFDCASYQARMGVAPAHQNPILHYLLVGASRGQTPNPLFDPAFFLSHLGGGARCPFRAPRAALETIAQNKALPPFHPFIDEAFLRGARDPVAPKAFYRALFGGAVYSSAPHPLVDMEFLAQELGQRFETMAEAFDAYWAAEEDVPTHALFDLPYYLDQAPGGGGIRRAAYHYLVSANPVSPNPLFDVAYYRRQARRAVSEVPNRAFEHFISVGQGIGLDPSAYFDTAFYCGQTGCERDALHHYMSGGHRLASPHPLIRPAEAGLLAQALDEPDRPMAARIAAGDSGVPDEAVPDFDPVFWRRRAGDAIPKDACDAEIRDHYFRDGYADGRRPNGLLSPVYIARQAALTPDERPGAIQHYFEQAWDQRRRILVAIPSLEDTPMNRTWLEVARAQIRNTALDLVVVAAADGPLEGEFSTVSHLWTLPKPSGPARGADKHLKNSLERCLTALRGNAPAVVFLDAGLEGPLVEMLRALPTPIVLCDPAKLPVAASDLGAPDADLVWAPKATQPAASEATPPQIGGFRAVDARPRSDAWVQRTRRGVRGRLGIPQGAFVVAGSGAFELESGMDVFAAIAAMCLRADAGPEDLFFLWQGSGSEFPNTPAFYAKYLSGLAVDGPNFQLVQDFDASAVLASADLFLVTDRMDRDHGARAAADAVGCPAVVMSDPSGAAGFSFAAYDVGRGAELIAQLRAKPELLQSFAGAAKRGLSPRGSLNDFLAGLGRCMRAVGCEAHLDDAAVSFDADRVLVLMGDAGAKAVREADLCIYVQDTPHGPRVSAEDVQDLPLSDELLAHLTGRAAHDFTFCQAASAMDQAWLNGFDRVVWLMDGQRAELERVYRLGASCDEIVLRNPELADEIAQLNPEIGQRLVAGLGGAQ